MWKLDYLIVRQDGSGNLLKQKKKNIKYRSKGAYRELPIDKGKYDRNFIKNQVKEEMER